MGNDALLATLKSLNDYIYPCSDADHPSQVAPHHNFTLNQSKLIGDLHRAFPHLIATIKSAPPLTNNPSQSTAAAATSAFNPYMDAARQRTFHRLTRNNSRRGALIAGAATSADLNDLTNNDQSLYPAALVYLLLKQRTAHVVNLELPYNAQLLNNMATNAPVLHDFLMEHSRPTTALNTPSVNAAHTSTTLTTAQSAAHTSTTTTLPPPAYITMDHQHDTIYTPLTKQRETYYTCADSAVQTTPDDTTFNNYWSQHIADKKEFNQLAQGLTVYLKYCAQIHPSIDERPQVRLNPQIISRARRTASGAGLTATGQGRSNGLAVYVNPLTSLTAMESCSYFRVALATTIARADMFINWRGPTDARRYEEHNNIATRGSQGRVFGWCVKRLEDQHQVKQLSMDMNPYALYVYAADTLDNLKPYVHTRRRDTFDLKAHERLLDTPTYDTVQETWTTRYNKMIDMD